MWKTITTVTSDVGYTLEEIFQITKLFDNEIANGNIAEPPLPDEQIGAFDEHGCQYIRYWNTEADAYYWKNLRDNLNETANITAESTWTIEEVSE